LTFPGLTGVVAAAALDVVLLVIAIFMNVVVSVMFIVDFIVDDARLVTSLAKSL
jgi:hypothetical protein